jgi:hypothetical protein
LHAACKKSFTAQGPVQTMPSAERKKNAANASLPPAPAWEKAENEGKYLIFADILNFFAIIRFWNKEH